MQARLNRGKRVRLFLDSNVLTAGVVSAWGLDKALLSMCAARICRLVLTEAVRDEVEENLLTRLDETRLLRTGSVVNDYARLIALMKPEIVPYPSAAEVTASRHLIRHTSDVPVLLSATASRPDWILTHNTKHFTQSVAKRTGLRIATPVMFFEELSKAISGYR